MKIENSIEHMKAVRSSHTSKANSAHFVRPTRLGHLLSMPLAKLPKADMKQALTKPPSTKKIPALPNILQIRHLREISP